MCTKRNEGSVEVRVGGDDSVKHDLSGVGNNDREKRGLAAFCLQSERGPQGLIFKNDGKIAKPSPPSLSKAMTQLSQRMRMTRCLTSPIQCDVTFITSQHADPSAVLKFVKRTHLRVTFILGKSTSKTHDVVCLAANTPTFSGRLFATTKKLVNVECAQLCNR